MIHQTTQHGIFKRIVAFLISALISAQHAALAANEAPVNKKASSINASIAGIDGFGLMARTSW